jgi:Flp pilus assembly protein TadG
MARVMRQKRVEKRGESGGTLLEFTFVAVTFFTMLLAIASGSNLYFTHNALVEATRRGARFASTQAANSPAGLLRTGTDVGPSVTAIRNYTVYGNVTGTGSNVLSLAPTSVHVEYKDFGVGSGTVSVYITDYSYSVLIPFISRQIAMPANRTTVRGESAGTLPSTTACP